MPQIVAHRGASEAEPEHTAAAYRLALTDGADGFECDVRLTADHHLVCVHDRRLDRTSTGTGLVSTTRLADLQRLDWGAWRELPATGDDDPDLAADRAGLLTLRGLFDLVQAAGRPLAVAVETKHPTRHGSRVEQRLAELLAEYGWSGQDGRPTPVRVMSFSARALRRLNRLAPGVPLVQLVDRAPHRDRPVRFGPGVVAAGVSVDLLRAHPAYLRRIQQAGYAVHVWTVDEDEDVDRCLTLDVETIITNRPAAVRARLAHRVAGC